MNDTNLLEDQPIAWTPTPDVIERSRLMQFMRQVGVSTWDELYEFSITDVEKFTEEVLKFLDIKFNPPYEKLLDTSNGLEFPTWFGRNADTPVRNEGEARKGWHTRGYLPHYDGETAQFITFRLADSLPQAVLRKLKLELEHEKLQDPSREYRRRVEEYLDQGIGECLLGNPRVAEILSETILHEHGRSCKTYSWVIMPNHGHILLRPLEGNSVPQIMKRIKGVSARRINELLGRSGPVWQPDYFDRYIRNADHFNTTVKYIRNNPVKAGLCSIPEDWIYSSLNWNADTPVRNEGRFGPNKPHITQATGQHKPASPEEPATADMSVRVPSHAGLNITTMCLDRWQTEEMKDQPAVIWEDERGDTARMTYAELHKSVESCAASLRKRGLKARDAIGIHLPMMVNTVVALLAINRIGAIATPVFSGYGVDAIASRMNAVGAKAIFTVSGFLRRGKVFDAFTIALEAISKCPTIGNIFVEDQAGSEYQNLYERHADEYSKLGDRLVFVDGLIEQSETLANRTTKNQNLRKPEPTSAEDPLIILYTSGTTGKPKGIAHTHASFPIKAAQDMAFGTDVGKGTRICWYTDIGWMMGPWLIYGALINGATICIYDGAPDYPTPDRMWEFCAKHKVEVLGISPTLVRALAAAEDRNADTPVRNEGRSGPNKPEIAQPPGRPKPASPEEPAIADKSVRVPPHERHDLSSLRIFASTGEPWNPAPWWWLFEKVGSSKLPIINYSGGTEIAGGILMGNPLLPIKPCSFPAPCPGMDVDILDEDGNSVEPGKVGELVIKQPWIGMARGFWQEKERYLETYWRRFKDIWVHGDWAMRDKDGHWFILGRSDDTLKVAGKRVGPAEVESLLVAHPLVTEAAVIGVPDEVKGTAMVAFAVLSPDGTRTPPSAMSPKGEPSSDASSSVTDAGLCVLLETELKALVAKDMGKPLAPSKIHFVSALPKTRNAKVMRRVIRAAYLGEDPGDLSALEDPRAVDEISALQS
ncbi:MAG TPA: AMP-binding protein [Pyrinomonadaceae bacterium]|nr:AMP-binding protein [Pyrinomonadaceae bacterium]